jgi:hypothetical protein
MIDRVYIIYQCIDDTKEIWRIFTDENIARRYYNLLLDSCEREYRLETFWITNAKEEELKNIEYAIVMIEEDKAKWINLHSKCNLDINDFRDLFNVSLTYDLKTLKNIKGELQFPLFKGDTAKNTSDLKEKYLPYVQKWVDRWSSIENKNMAERNSIVLIELMDWWKLQKDSMGIEN